MARKSVRDNVKSWVVVGPSLIYYTFFSIVPLFILIWYSMTDTYALYPEGAQFVGLDNFVTILKSSEFWQIMRNTLAMSGLIMVLTITIAFVVALMLTAQIKGRGFFRTVWYIPSLVSMGVISQMIAVIIRPSGLLNNMLQQLGIFGPEEFTVWTKSTVAMYVVIVALSVWRGLGGSVLLYMAGLIGIPKETLEAAKVDGANPAQILFKIKMPLLMPTFAFIIINNVINIFGLFEPIQLISMGGPDGKTNTIMYEIYNLAFTDFRQGYASAVSVIVLLITLGCTCLSTSISKKSYV